MRSCMAFFCRVLSILVIAAVGVCLPSQRAPANSFNWQSVNRQNWNTPIESQFGGDARIFPPVPALRPSRTHPQRFLFTNDNVFEQKV